MAKVEIETVWVRQTQEGPEDLKGAVELMLGDGWELVQWHPVMVQPANAAPLRYDVFLLQREDS